MKGKWREAGALLLLLVSVLCGCGQGKEALEQPEEEVVITVLFRMDPQTNEEVNADLVRAFNEAYEGRYRVEVEWLIETEVGYRTKIKQLNAVDKLPAVITDVGFDYKFLQLLKENDRLVDLSPYFEKSDDWKGAVRPDILSGMQEEDGSIYVSPLGNLMYSSAGIIYNKELLKKAGYDEFPRDWEEFETCLRRLEAAEITPLALHGAGNYWVPMLLSTAYCWDREEDKRFLKERSPLSYDNDTMYKLMPFMKQLYQYSFEDALEIEYNETEKRFLNGEAAIIANGPWMFMKLREEEKAKYGFAVFPGDVLVGSWEMTAWVAIEAQPPQVREGAVEFLKFRTLREYKNALADVERSMDTPENDIMKMYTNQAWETQNLAPNYQVNWEQGIINDYMIDNIPLYVKGQVDIDEFLKNMDAAAEEIAKSQ